MIYEERIVIERLPSSPLKPVFLTMGESLIAIQLQYERSALLRLRIPRIHANISWLSWRIEREDHEVRFTAILRIRNLVASPRPLP
jgi:hypothetical protein